MAVGREARALAVANSSGGSKLWRWQQALEAVASFGDALRNCWLVTARASRQLRALKFPASTNF